MNRKSDAFQANLSCGATFISLLLLLLPFFEYHEGLTCCYPYTAVIMSFLLYAFDYLYSSIILTFLWCRHNADLIQR